jgi:hypothetical protein
MKLAETRELDDLVEARSTSRRRCRARTGDVDVFAAGDLGVEAGAELDQRRHPAVDHQRARGGAQDARRSA